MDAELEYEKRRVAVLQQEWSDMSVAFGKASKNVTEAERAKRILEVRLAALHQDIAKKDAILASQQGQAEAAVLEHTFSKETARRERVLGLDSIRQDLLGKLRQCTAAQDALRTQLIRAQTDGAGCAPPAFEDPSKETLKIQLQEASRVEGALKERLRQAEDDLSAASSREKGRGDAAAQLAENRAKFEQFFRQVQNAEREKGAFEAKFLALQKDLQAKQAQLATLPSLENALEERSAADGTGTEVSALVNELKAAKTLQVALKQELQGARENPTRNGATRHQISGLEAALAEERQRAATLQLEIDQGFSQRGADNGAEVLRARSAADRAKEREKKAESKLAKERKYFERVWECVRDAEVARKALETRLSMMEQSFKSMGGDERVINLHVEMLQEKQRVTQLQTQ
jgi:hypothetical protein